MKLVVDDINVSEVLQSRIIQLVSRIDFYGHDSVQSTDEMLEQFFRAIVAGELSQLKTVYWAFDLSLSSICPELMSEAVVRLEKFYVHSKLSFDKTKAILEKIIKTEDLKLKKLGEKGLNPSWPDLKVIPLDILMKAAVKLEETNIYLSINGTEKPVWYKFIAESPVMKMKYLDTKNLGIKPTWNIPPDFLAAALVRVKEAKAYYLNKAQSLALFNKIASGEKIKLRKLNIGYSNLCRISPELMSEVVLRLENIDLHSTDLTPDQVKRMFHKIANSENLSLTKLGVSCNNLSSVAAEVLVAAIIRLESVDLAASRLTPAQINHIFTSDFEDLKLTKLDVSHSNLSSVAAEVLVAAIIRLESVDLAHSCLTPAQISHIFNTDFEDLKLTKLDIGGNDLTSVLADDLVRISRLETVDLSRTYLTNAQRLAIYSLPGGW